MLKKRRLITGISPGTDLLELFHIFSHLHEVVSSNETTFIPHITPANPRLGWSRVNKMTLSTEPLCKVSLLDLFAFSFLKRVSLNFKSIRVQSTLQTK